jgi:hypothetical protein
MVSPSRQVFICPPRAARRSRIRYATVGGGPVAPPSVAEPVSRRASHFQRAWAFPRAKKQMRFSRSGSSAGAAAVGARGFALLAKATSTGPGRAWSADPARKRRGDELPDMALGLALDDGRRRARWLLLFITRQLRRSPWARFACTCLRLHSGAGTAHVHSGLWARMGAVQQWLALRNGDGNSD